MKRTFLIFCTFCAVTLFAQKEKSIVIKNGIETPSFLPTHHFGIFSSRIQANFKVRPPDVSTLSFSVSSGNTFHPFVEAHLPKDPAVRDALSKIVWYNRYFNFVNQQKTPAEYMNIVVDAVIKEFRVNYATKIAKNQELTLSLRSYLITDGSYPFSFITSDESIEWFHSNIAGGEDPFGRKYYGLNQVNVKYTDRNGRILELKENDFFIGGLETHYYYYPQWFHKSNIRINLGAHLGINTSRFNPSIDIGISANMIKKWRFKNNNEFRFALGANLLRKNLVSFGNIVELGNNAYLAALEPHIEYTKYTRKRNFHAFGIHYQIQTSYSKRSEANYYRLLGKWKEIHSGWQHGITSMYEYLSAWTFLYTYGRPNYSLSLYLKEDLLVNNAPDVQTGISLKIPLKH